MFPSYQLEELISKAIEHLSIENNYSSENLNILREEAHKSLDLNPAKVLVLAGLLGGALNVTSVVIRRDQSIDVVLTGSLKKTEKTELEKAMEQVGKLPFDEVMKAMLGGIGK